MRTKTKTTRRGPLSILFLYALFSLLVFLIRKYSLAGGMEAKLDHGWTQIMSHGVTFVEIDSRIKSLSMSKAQKINQTS